MKFTKVKKQFLIFILKICAGTWKPLTNANKEVTAMAGEEYKETLPSSTCYLKNFQNSDFFTDLRII